jgi:exonuclease SbcD
MASSIRLLHLADIHIGMENYGQMESSVGVNSRVMDFLRCFDEAVNHALNNEIDLVIFAGDAFKTRDPNSTYRREFARRIKKLADAGIPVVLLVGNHDMPNAAKRASSIGIFQTLDVPNVLVADTDKLHTLTTRRGQPVQVATIPYPLRSRLAAHEDYKALSMGELDAQLQMLVTETILALAQQTDSAIPAILAAHLAISEAKLGSERSVMIGRDVAILKSVIAHPAFDYVALGHIHKYQDINLGAQPPVVYAGSIERIDFGEENEDKGFVIADISKGNTIYQFVPVKARRFITIRVRAQTSDPMTEIMAEIERYNVQDAIVRVIIQVEEENARLIQEKEIRQALRDAHHISSIQKEVNRRYRQRLGGLSAESLTPREALQKYLEAKGTPETRVEKLLEYAERIFQESI